MSAVHVHIQVGAKHFAELKKKNPDKYIICTIFLKMFKYSIHHRYPHRYVYRGTKCSSDKEKTYDTESSVFTPAQIEAIETQALHLPCTMHLEPMGGWAEPRPRGAGWPL